MHLSKMMIGTRTGNGVVPMNQRQPRPARETAVAVASLADGPYDYFAVDGLRHLSATVTCGEPADTEAAGAVVAMEGTVGDPVDGAWQQLDISGTLDGDDAAANSDLLVWEGAMRFVRFVASAAENNDGGSDPDSVVSVEFFGN